MSKGKIENLLENLGEESFNKLRESRVFPIVERLDTNEYQIVGQRQTTHGRTGTMASENATDYILAAIGRLSKPSEYAKIELRGLVTVILRDNYDTYFKRETIEKANSSKVEYRMIPTWDSYEKAKRVIDEMDTIIEILYPQLVLLKLSE